MNDKKAIGEKPSRQVDECFDEAWSVIESCLSKLSGEEQIDFVMALRAQLGALI
jgi:hypothetical protein